MVRPPRTVESRPRSRAVIVLMLAGLAASTALGATSQSAADAIARIRSALDAGHTAEAMAAAEAAVDRYPESPRVAVWAAHTLRRAGELTAAARAYGRAQALAPEDPEVAMGMGSLHEAVGDPISALAAYDRAIELAPQSAAPWRAAGALQMRADNHQAAAHYFKGFIDLQPIDLQVRYLLGVALYLVGDYDAAVEVLEAGLDRAPDDVPTGYALGVILADRPSDHDRALRLLRRAAEARFEESEASYLVGRILSDAGEFDQAIVNLRHAVELQPRHLEATYRLAQALSRTGATDEGQLLAERFRQLQQDFNAREAGTKELKTLSNALVAATRAGDREEVDRVLAAMLAVAPDDPEVLLRAAKIWLSSGDPQAAANAAIAAAQIDPGNWEALYLQGLSLERAGQAADAVHALRASLGKNPLFADTYAVLGNALLALEQTRAAVSAYLAAADLDAENPVYWLNLATAYQTLEQTDLAERAMQEYRRLSDGRNSERR